MITLTATVQPQPGEPNTYRVWLSDGRYVIEHETMTVCDRIAWLWNHPNFRENSELQEIVDRRRDHV